MLAKYALDNGGRIIPLSLEYSDSNGTGVMNPSIYNDNGTLLVNIRHVNYAIYHCRNFFHEYGPLQYIHEEHDRVLKTTNFIGQLNSDLKLTQYWKVDTSEFDSEPKWTFIGLEDARLVRLAGELYQIGVRRDTETTGIGRMELSKLRFYSDEGFKEVSRVRIKAPGDDSSYCEKNWMPIVDQPFNFVKWTNPTEIATTDINGNTTSIVKNYFPVKDCPRDLRGSSHVIKLDKHYIAITHEVAFYNSELKQKDAIYRHRAVIWDEDFNIVKVTKMFDFLNANIEFCAGMCQYKNDILISFGRQDNSAYILTLPVEAFKNYIWKL